MIFAKKRILCVAAAICAFFALTMLFSSCAVLRPDDTGIIFTPNGELYLGMTRKQVDKIFEPEAELDLDSSYLVDYGDVVIVYDTSGYAINIKSFAETAHASNGVTIGMSFTEVIEKCPNWVYLTEVMERQTLEVAYGEKGKKPEKTIRYYLQFQFVDGVVERIVLQDPAY